MSKRINFLKETVMNMYNVKVNETHMCILRKGENFTASASNEGWYVLLWDTHWEQVELYDIDELARLKKTIN